MSHIQAKFQTSTVERGQQRIASPTKPRPTCRPRTPHITKLMALAIRLEELLATGQVKDQAEIARTAGISRARVTQILNLNQLSPMIQRDLLSLPATQSAENSITEREARSMHALICWRKQGQLWNRLLKAKQPAVFGRSRQD